MDVFCCTKAICPETDTGFTVSVAVLVPLLYVPVMVTVVTLATELVLTENVAVVAPAATLTLAGTCAAVVLLLVSPTVAPPVGAAPLSVTVPVDELPPVTLVGFTETEDKLTDEELLIVAVVWAVFCAPLSSVTVRLTVYVPAVEYVCEVVTPVPVPPSPKFHA